MSQANSQNAAVSTERILSANPRKVFAAFEQPAWVQEFESPEVAAKMRPLSGTANEQVLDRLQVLLASESS